MAEIRDRGSVLATEEGIQVLKNARAAMRNHEDKPLTYINIGDKSGVSDKTVERFFKGKQPIDESTARSTCQALGVEFNNVVEARLSVDTSDNQEYRINWRGTCRDLLDKWKGLTTNVLTTTNGVRFQLDEIFVPLGVVERRRQTKHRSDGGSPEKGSELYEEQVTPISQDDFFERVLRQHQSKNSQGNRIAIIGEPGAGKTTQLQKIGEWILKETDGVPIWISLASVGTKPLREYLLNDWLQTTTQELEIPQQYRDGLGELLKTGRVWLLLDGVDEMAIADALRQLATQMTEGWLQAVRVVLTCRLNVWNAGKNALDCFDVYRNLDFDYPREVHQFIDKWFMSEAELQQALKSALVQPGKERIRDMVKNPLRLTLLCYSWQLRQGELPETKAGLYEWFVDTFYEWNKGKVPIKLTTLERKELNLALGKLSKGAIDQESSRFRLSEKFVEQFLGDFDDEDSLFYLALQLGWLNRVGIAEENPLENVYAFFHPTFQEYFAALAIDNWHFFFNHIPENLNHPEANYRIFQAQWKEVILLWLGRQNVIAEQKDKFVQALSRFDDNCCDIYSMQSYLLAVSSLSEFSSNRSDEIVTRSAGWAVGIHLGENKGIKTCASLMQPMIQSALGGSNSSKVVSAIVKIINFYVFENPGSYSNGILSKSIEIIDLAGQNNSEAIESLIKVMIYNHPLFILLQMKASKSLLKIAQGHPIAIHRLEEMLSLNQDRQICLQISSTLEEMNNGNFSAHNFLSDCMGSHQPDRDRLDAAWHCINADAFKSDAFKTLDALKNSQDEKVWQEIQQYTQWQISQAVEQVPKAELECEPISLADIEAAKKTCQQDPHFIDYLAFFGDLMFDIAVCRVEEEISRDSDYIATLMDTLQEKLNQCSSDRDDISASNIIEAILWILGRVTTGNDVVAKRLIHLLKATEIASFSAQLPKALTKIVQGDLLAIAVGELREVCEKQDFPVLDVAYQIMISYAMRMSYPEFYRAWHEQN